jgi:hypothetical protein
MTMDDLQACLARTWNRLRSMDWPVPGRRTRSLIIEFSPSAIGLLPGIEQQFAADQLRRKATCRTVMTINDTQLRVDGVPARELTSFLRVAASLGARHWAAIN